jgi:hypothetical protein
MEVMSLDVKHLQVTLKSQLGFELVMTYKNKHCFGILCSMTSS